MSFYGRASSMLQAVALSGLHLAANWDFIPLLILYQSVQNAVHVWAVKRSLAKSIGKAVDHRLVAMIILCRIYIRIPPDMGFRELGDYVGLYSSVTHQSANLQINTRDKELRPTDRPSKILQLPDTVSLISNVTNVAERAALWASGLPSELVSMSTRQSLEIAGANFHAWGYLFPRSQACLYLMSISPRILQPLSMSPLETILVFMSILVLWQTIFEVYACGSYQHPLILRLNRIQVSRFCNTPRDDLTSYFTWYHLLIFKAFWLSITFLLLIISMYYFLHYHQHAHFLRSLSALLFFFHVSMFGIILHMARYRVIILLCSNAMFVCSVIVALISAIKDSEAWSSICWSIVFFGTRMVVYRQFSESNEDSFSK